jgi:hypothetical protein
MHVKQFFGLSITLPLLLRYYDESKFKTTPTNNYNMIVSNFSYKFIQVNRIQAVMDSLKFNLQSLVNWFKIEAFEKHLFFPLKNISWTLKHKLSFSLQVKKKVS